MTRFLSFIGLVASEFFIWAAGIICIIMLAEAFSSRDAWDRREGRVKDGMLGMAAFAIELFFLTVQSMTFKQFDGRIWYNYALLNAFVLFLVAEVLHLIEICVNKYYEKKIKPIDEYPYDETPTAEASESSVGDTIITVSLIISAVVRFGFLLVMWLGYFGLKKG